MGCPHCRRFKHNCGSENYIKPPRKSTPDCRIAPVAGGRCCHSNTRRCVCSAGFAGTSDRGPLVVEARFVPDGMRGGGFPGTGRPPEALAVSLSRTKVLVPRRRRASSDGFPNSDSLPEHFRLPCVSRRCTVLAMTTSTSMPSRNDFRPTSPPWRLQSAIATPALGPTA